MNKQVLAFVELGPGSRLCLQAYGDSLWLRIWLRSRTGDWYPTTGAPRIRPDQVPLLLALAQHASSIVGAARSTSRRLADDGDVEERVA